MPAVLRMSGIAKSFGATAALSGVDLEVQAGEVLALVGENGAGKSTLMKVLSGAHRSDAGKMELAGTPYRPEHPHDARCAGVCMVYQELSLAPHLSVAENILLGIEPKRAGFVHWAEVRRRAAAALEELGCQDISLTEPAGQLSLARRQMVEIARAVASGCRVLVLDEPTSSLAAADVQKLFALIRRLKARGCGIIYISHFLEEVREICDRVTVLRDGRSVGGGQLAELTDAEIILKMAGREVADLYPRSVRSRGPVVLQVDEVAGPKLPVHASLTLHRGEVLGIAGLIGSGRTELLRVIFGLDPMRRGRIDVDGAAGGPVSPARRWRQSVGLVSEDRKGEGLALALSVEHNIVLSRLSGLGAPGWVWPHRAHRVAEQRRGQLGIKCQDVSEPAGHLSGGNQQKIALARLLHAEVDLLLLDEPTRGIDVGAKADIYRLIDELALSGKAVVMVSSYLPELLGVCDRIAVMTRGHLGSARPVEEVSELSLMTEATGS